MPKNKYMSFGASRASPTCMVRSKVKRDARVKSEVGGCVHFSTLFANSLADICTVHTCTRKLPVGLWVDPLENNVLAAE